jgi:hypothetical protein
MSPRITYIPKTLSAAHHSIPWFEATIQGPETGATVNQIRRAARKAL